MEDNENKQLLIEPGDMPKMIEIPDHIKPESAREALHIPVRDLGETAIVQVTGGRYNNGVVPVAGRYGTPPVPVERPVGIPVEYNGDASSAEVLAAEINSEEV